MIVLVFSYLYIKLSGFFPNVKVNGFFDFIMTLRLNDEFFHNLYFYHILSYFIIFINYHHIYRISSYLSYFIIFNHFLYFSQCTAYCSCGISVIRDRSLDSPGKLRNDPYRKPPIRKSIHSCQEIILYWKPGISVRKRTKEKEITAPCQGKRLSLNISFQLNIVLILFSHAESNLRGFRNRPITF